MRLASGAATARFAWFPLAGVIPTAVVEHRNRDIAFAAELRDHPYGATRLNDVLFGGGLRDTAGPANPNLARVLLAPALAPGIAGFSIAGCGAFSDIREGHTIRGLP